MRQFNMTRNSFTATALALLVSCQSYASSADESKVGKVPPIVPATDEIPVRGVPAFSIHLELEQCLKDAAALLGREDSTLHVHIGASQAFYSHDSGFVLRADFTRDDVSAPLINRIVCWQNGQLIALRLSAPPLSPELSKKAIAVPQAIPRQN
jgi:hypothetical protein